MAKKTAWREFLDMLEKDDPAVLANTFSVPIPEKADEQLEMLVRVLPRLSAALPAVSRSKVFHTLRMLVQRMGAKPAVENGLLELYQLRGYPDMQLTSAQERAALGLLGIASPSSLAALIERVEAAVVAGAEIETSRQFVDWKYPIDAIALASHDLLATAKNYASPKRMATPLGRQLALEVLWKAWYAKTRSSKDDEAWAAFLVTLWAGPFSQYARDYLLLLPQEIVLPLLRARLGPPRVAITPPTSPRWLTRYQKGEHEKVWKEMREIGHHAFEVPEVLEVARATMTRARQEIERIGAVLAKGKYRFHAKKKWHVAPTSKTAAEIAKLEKMLRLRLPLSLRAFVEIVGSVDLTDVYDYEEYDERAAEARGPFAGLGRLDPLEVIRTSEMLERSKPYLVNKAGTKGPPELEPVSQILFGYAPVCKYTEEDASPMYRVELRFVGADAPVFQASQPEEQFVDYLRATLGAGGFRGLEGLRTQREKRQREALLKGAIAF